MKTDTTAAPAPKVKLVETAARLVYQQGWNATGINQILVEAKVPKGSFYYYFHSKEELGAAILRHYRDQYEENCQKTLLNIQMSAKEAIESFLKMHYENYRIGGWRWGCPIGTFANETVDSSEMLRIESRSSFAYLKQALEQALSRGQKEGAVRSEISAAELAFRFCIVFQGALLCMKIEKTQNSLENAFDFIRSLIFV